MVFAHDYMLHIGTHTFPHTLTEVQLLKCLCAFATPFSAAYLPTLARSSAVKVVVYLRPPAGSFLCMFWTALLAERTAFSGRLVSSVVGRQPLFNKRL